MPMRYLTSAQEVGELALIKSLCDANSIRCILQHEHVSSLYPGCSALLCQVFVDDVDWDRAGTLLRRLRLPIREAEPSS